MAFQKKLELAIGNRYNNLCQRNDKKKKDLASKDRWWKSNWFTVGAGVGVGAAAAVLGPAAIGAVAIGLLRLFR